MNGKNTAVTLLKAFAAGVFISVGGAVFLSCESRYLGALLFAVGLFVICTMGLLLFTGKVCYVFENDMNYAAGLVLIWLGNLAGCAVSASLFRMTRIAGIAEKASGMCDTKLAETPLSVFILGIFCNILIWIAVEGYKKSRTSSESTSPSSSAWSCSSSAASSTASRTCSTLPLPAGLTARRSSSSSSTHSGTPWAASSCRCSSRRAESWRPERPEAPEKSGAAIKASASEKHAKIPCARLQKADTGDPVFIQSLICGSPSARLRSASALSGVRLRVQHLIRRPASRQASPRSSPRSAPCQRRRAGAFPRR